MSHAEARENTSRVSNNRVRSFRSVAARAMPLCDKWVALKIVEFVSTGFVVVCIDTRLHYFTILLERITPVEKKYNSEIICKLLQLMVKFKIIKYSNNSSLVLT